MEIGNGMPRLLSPTVLAEQPGKNGIRQEKKTKESKTKEIGSEVMPSKNNCEPTKSNKESRKRKAEGNPKVQKQIKEKIHKTASLALAKPNKQSIPVKYEDLIATRKALSPSSSSLPVSNLPEPEVVDLPDSESVISPDAYIEDEERMFVLPKGKAISDIHVNGERYYKLSGLKLDHHDKNFSKGDYAMLLGRGGLYFVKVIEKVDDAYVKIFTGDKEILEETQELLKIQYC